jgi:hypothetical protein
LYSLNFLTERPDTVGAIAQVQSQRWLESRGFTLPIVYASRARADPIAASLGVDIVVDDNLHSSCLEVVHQR